MSYPHYNQLSRSYNPIMPLLPLKQYDLLPSIPSPTPIEATPSRKRKRPTSNEESSGDFLGYPSNQYSVNSDLAGPIVDCIIQTRLADSSNETARNQMVGCFGSNLPAELESTLLNNSTVPLTSIDEASEPQRKFHRRSTISTFQGQYDPARDEIRRLLGVGWTLFSQDFHMQAAMRGWARYIENHYPLSSVHILLQSKGLEGYLTATAQGYYLFTEDLSEGRLVGATWTTCVANLQSWPIRFEGVEVLRAARTPTPLSDREKTRPCWVCC